MSYSKIFNAICFFPVEQNKTPLKYRKIMNERKFSDFVRNKGCIYFNMYEHPSSKQKFIKRVYL